MDSGVRYRDDVLLALCSRITKLGSLKFIMSEDKRSLGLKESKEASLSSARCSQQDVQRFKQRMPTLLIQLKLGWTSRYADQRTLFDRLHKRCRNIAHIATLVLDIFEKKKEELRWSGSYCQDSRRLHIENSKTVVTVERNTFRWKPDINIARVLCTYCPYFTWLWCLDIANIFIKLNYY